MALIYQPSKRIFCGWFEPLKSTTYSEYPKLETLSGGKFHERLNKYAASFADAHKAGRVTDEEFAEGITVGIWIGACLAHVRIEWQDIEEIKEQE